MKFSQRIGKSPIRVALQVESIDTSLENKLWNCFLLFFIARFNSVPNRGESELGIVYFTIWEQFFEYRIDEIPRTEYGRINTISMLSIIKSWFFKAEWYKKYDFIEYSSWIADNNKRLEFTQNCNKILESELSGYRLINNLIVPITSELELSEIDEAFSITKEYDSTQTHLKTALDYLSDRESPDYRNSIKESISAVESYCGILIGEGSVTLGKALAKVEKKYKIHNGLKSAFSVLYGFTSDSGGIRHCLLENDISIGMEEAKFMLVSCSAFINYLTAKSNSSI